jgi:L-fuculose-phosphate aldolase
MREVDAKRLVNDIAKRMYRQGYIVAGDGNVSVKLDDERIVVTPSGLPKGFMNDDDMIVVDLAGKRLSGKHKPSSEFLMHQLAYTERPDCGAVIHGHPVFATGLALAGISLAQCVLSETCLTLGGIETAPYSTPTTEEVPNILRPFVRCSNAIIMNRHGALTLGRDLEEAYGRFETLEHTAKITHAARVLGPVSPMPAHEVSKLNALVEKFGIPRPPEPCKSCNACPNGTGGPGKTPFGATEADVESIVEAVVRAVRS